MHQHTYNPEETGLERDENGVQYKVDYCTQEGCNYKNVRRVS